MTASRSEDLWRELHEALFRFIRRRVADDATADDILQDTVLRVHERLHQLSDDTRIAPWVYRIARNRIADHYRRRPGTSAPTDDTLTAELADVRDDGDGDGNSARNRLVGAWLTAMIDAQPPRYREALRLVELDGLSQTEAAERLGLSVSGAKSRVQRGRARLRQQLDECCRVELDRRGNVLDVEPRRPCCD